MHWPEGVLREVHPSLDSTNAEAVRRANSGERGPIWFLALEQTAGKARRGRVWRDLSGNFSASLLMRPECSPNEAALRSFIAALALREALIEMCGREDIFTLKWPNDVLLNNRKLAGILLESGPDFLCIGIGVNLAQTPNMDQLENTAMPPICLREATGLTVTPEEFLPALATAFQRWEGQFQQFGFAPIRTAWLQHAARLGEVITAKLPTHVETGTFETVDETGAIVLQTAKGALHLSAADIHFGAI